MADTRGRWLSVADVCARLAVSRATFDKWRARGCAPRMIRLPNGTLRCREDWFEDWVAGLREPDAYERSELDAARRRRTYGPG